ncbi:hypothetical protein [Cellulomonas cellasea]|uniref:Lipoprotein n=1 Tax=Cellulomonas cellasea TaxID=43670 RepID=A0A7W4Y9Z0_9CELL|nr:hypothetical protein [Cellulomonas cellasea]MBB2922210.1 hypothetical protein [Cellulomonas cellasea]
MTITPSRPPGLPTVAVGASTLVLMPLVSGCADEGLGRRAAEDAQRKALLVTARVDSTVAEEPGSSGPALAEAVAAAATSIGAFVTTSVVTSSGVELGLEIDGNATSGGGLFVSSASRRLCLVLTVDPRKDPPSRLTDVECTDLPPGYKEIDLDDSAMDGDPVADGVGGRPNLLTWS